MTSKHKKIFKNKVKTLNNKKNFQKIRDLINKRLPNDKYDL